MEDTAWERLAEERDMNNSMKVDWNNAPEGAQFYSASCFRMYLDGWEYYWEEDMDNEWNLGYYEPISLHKELYSDFEIRPMITTERVDEILVDAMDAANSVNVPETTQWTASHYDNYYQLTPEDIKVGKVKIDAYFVNKMWKLNQKDDTGGLFHSLKTIARFGEKNPIERELKALYNQTKRMAELYGVELE